jgi:BA14K-like protein
VDNLEKARAEIAMPSTKQPVNVEEKPAAVEAKPLISDEKPVPAEEKSPSSPEKPVEAEISNSIPKQSDGVLPGTGNPVVAPVDRLGAISVPARAELDPRKATGPAGCTHFRSFDPVSGTYTTFSGRRRECR